MQVLPDVRGIDRAFDYALPARLGEAARPGTIVRVPLQGRRVRGWGVSAGDPPAEGVALRDAIEGGPSGPPPGRPGGLAGSPRALGHRLVRHQRPAGTVVLGSAILTVRTAVSFATGSAFVYFVQPTVATGAVALAFLVSALARRPLTERLAHDFCPLDPGIVGRPAMRRFFVQISLLWGAVLLANTGVVLWLLLTSSVGAFVLERTIASWLMTAVGVGLSVAWFIRTTRRDGVRVRWGRPEPVRAPSG